MREPSSWRARLFAVLTVGLSGVFTVLMFRSLKLVADAWFIGCAFHADGSKTCRWDVLWVPDPCTSPPPPPPPPNTLGGSNGTLMHALFMSIAFGLLTPLGAISFTVRETAWPKCPFLSTTRGPPPLRETSRLPKPPFWPERPHSPLGCQREREREREREGESL